MAVDIGCVSSGQICGFPAPGLREMQVPKPQLELNESEILQGLSEILSKTVALQY